MASWPRNGCPVGSRFTQLGQKRILSPANFMHRWRVNARLYSFR